MEKSILKVARVLENFTQAELAKRAGLSSQSIISKIEAGYSTPSKETREKIARVLGQPEWLLFPMDKTDD